METKGFTKDASKRDKDALTKRLEVLLPCSVDKVEAILVLETGHSSKWIENEFLGALINSGKIHYDDRTRILSK